MATAKNKHSAQHQSGFPPLVHADSRVLVLGTMPGQRSLAEQQYYAHPRNLFWNFIADIAALPAAPSDYEARKLLLQQQHIALWDVCAACIREGSLDTAIQQEIPNSIDELLDRHPDIRTIGFNGQKAATLFRKYFRHRPGISYISLPSTSPANAGISREQKKEAWLQLVSGAASL